MRRPEPDIMKRTQPIWSNRRSTNAARLGALTGACAATFLEVE